MGIEPATLWSRVKGPIKYATAPPQYAVDFRISYKVLVYIMQTNVTAVVKRLTDQ